jgi:hypothetical protein
MIGSCRRKRRKSADNYAAEAYRLAGSFLKHIRHIVSSSRGTLPLSLDGGTGS